jgi:hypothetical protein
MGFRFRRTFTVIPGVRINLGKRGASVSVGVRGAHVTMGPRGTRTTVGIPGTGASCTKQIRPTRASGSPAAAASIPAILLTIGITLTIRAKSPDLVFVPILVVTLIVCVPWLVLVLLRRPVPEEIAAPKAEVQTDAPAKPDVRKILNAARERREKEKALEEAVRREQRTSALLSESRCFYKQGDETIGPVSFWRVRELIETDLLTPDVKVIAEGSDYWRTYAEWELIVVPPENGATFAKLSKAAHIDCFYSHANREVGPISLLAIFHYIRLGKLPADVKIRAAGSEHWTAASEV